jgi:hypothetical protein
MNRPVWVTELAGSFWQLAGTPAPFPRDLRCAITRALPVSVVARPGLTVAGLAGWLVAVGVPSTLGVADRRLRGALVAREGAGLLFVDAADDPAEQRFTAAHELAHFLRDYWRPRARTASALGVGALDVLDGRRPARVGERAQALLRGVRLEYFTHLLARTEDGCDAAVAAAEADADRLAFELLAPAEDALAAGADAGRLAARFGLPPAKAAEYAVLLGTGPAAGPVAERFAKFLRFVSNSPLPAGRDVGEGDDEQH